MTEAVVAKDGRLEDIRIVSGLSGGSNQLAMATFGEWRCNPASKDRRSAATLIPIICSEIRVLAAVFPLTGS